MSVEVTRRPTHQRPRIDFIPEPVQQYFRERGLSFGFRSNNEIMLAQDASVGWRAVRWDDFPDELRVYFDEKEGNCVGRGDMRLCVRSIADREAQRADEEEQRAAMESTEVFAEGLNETLQQLTGRRGQLAVAQGGDVRDYVRGGEKAVRAGAIAEDVLKAVEEAKRKSKEK